MNKFPVENLGKKYKNKETGEIAKFIGRCEVPSITLKFSDGNKINFGVKGLNESDWELIEEINFEEIQKKISHFKEKMNLNPNRIALNRNVIERINKEYGKDVKKIFGLKVEENELLTEECIVYYEDESLSGKLKELDTELGGNEGALTEDIRLAVKRIKEAAQNSTTKENFLKELDEIFGSKLI